LAFDKRLAQQDKSEDMCESCKSGRDDKTVAPVCVGKVAANDRANAITTVGISKGFLPILVDEVEMR
jgi:hypothetical protein